MSSTMGGFIPQHLYTGGAYNAQPVMSDVNFAAPQHLAVGGGSGFENEMRMHAAKTAEALALIAQNQRMLSEAIVAVAQGIAAMSELLEVLARPPKLIRDQSGKIVGIDRTEE